MAVDTVTHKDLSSLLGVSETTVKSYRRKFGAFIPVHSRGKPLRFKRGAVDVCRTIRDGFQENLSVEEIRDQLHTSFPVVADEPQGNTHVSVSDDSTLPRPTQDAATAVVFDQLLTQIENLTDVQEQVVQRLDAMHGVLVDFVSQQVERESTSAARFTELKEVWAEQLLGLRRVVAARRRQEPAPSSSVGKRIMVRNVYGDETEYFMRSEPASGSRDVDQPQTGGTEKAPPQDYLTQPLVIESGDEYLGVAGKSEGPFSMGDFVELLHHSTSGPKKFVVHWERRGRTWRMEAEQAQAVRPRSFALEAQQTTTPRGNTVALLQSVEKDGESVPPANLYAYIKELRERGA